jgi:hypothetical protein
MHPSPECGDEISGHGSSGDDPASAAHELASLEFVYFAPSLKSLRVDAEVQVRAAELTSHTISPTASLLACAWESSGYRRAALGRQVPRSRA